MTLYPLRLERALSFRLWGGTRLTSFLNLPPQQAEEPLAEVWQVYAHQRILNGPLAGQTLGAASERFGAALLGQLSVARYGTTFPLLAKFIDAADTLSIQVHPDDEFARTVEAASGHLGKAEAWYILEAAPGAKVIWGFRERLTPEQIRQAIAQGTLEAHLNHVPVAPGDVVYNPPGTLHAIGAGILLFEIQQSSDLTYRLYDFGRRDAAGRLRELHVDKALAVLRLEPGEAAKVSPQPLGPRKTRLVAVEPFAMERWEVSDGQAERTTPDSVEILTVIAGEVVLEVGDRREIMARGESVVLPAALGSYHLSGKGTLLRCYVPRL